MKAPGHQHRKALYQVVQTVSQSTITGLLILSLKTERGILCFWKCSKGCYSTVAALYSHRVRVKESKRERAKKESQRYYLGPISQRFPSRNCSWRGRKTCHIKSLFRSYTRIYPCSAEIHSRSAWYQNTSQMRLLWTLVVGFHFPPRYAYSHICHICFWVLTIRVKTQTLSLSLCSSDSFLIFCQGLFMLHLQGSILLLLTPVAHCFTLSVMKPACAGTHASTYADDADQHVDAVCTVKSQCIRSLCCLRPPVTAAVHL